MNTKYYPEKSSDEYQFQFNSVVLSTFTHSMTNVELETTTLAIPFKTNPQTRLTALSGLTGEEISI